MNNFKSTQNKGFQMTFKNGMTISVQFGTSNYCHRRNLNSSESFDPYVEMKQYIVESPDAEIAIWDEYGNFINFGFGDEVKGWCSPNQVASWIQIVSRAKNKQDLYEIAIINEMFTKD